ncbi:MAG: hypothetical protein KKF62_17685 [Bacteroidetes bacterium]|nr:hypothetical protein [Bacteroidota bacterium]MBU1117130.1 hypothetical protein [Bacteroidota bacterium]MBU1800327.1 hypothetical protein [Bacteroidota bacterium]
MKLKFVLIIILITTIIFSCGTENNDNHIVIGIPADTETINPLFSFSVEGGTITELLYLSLAQSYWDNKSGEMKYIPMIAKDWAWNRDDNSIVITIRDDIFWSDGVKFSIDDIIFSFDIYSDPKVQSRALGYFEKFITYENGHVDTSKTFEKLDNNKLKIKFKVDSKPQIFDIDLLIVPKHFWSKFNREEIPTLNINTFVTCGAYKLEKWEKEQAVILAKNPKSFLVSDETIDKIIFKIIPEYQNRLSQLMVGDIDFMEDIKTDDIAGLKNISNLNVVPISGRDFDYIGWNNISPIDYANSKITPNKFFGNPEVRRALTIALDRDMVVNEYLNGYGAIASSPVSKIFTSIYDSTIVKLAFNTQLAKSILKTEGWIDTNGDGTIDKNGTEFSFVMHIPSGNPRREFAASLFQNNLKTIGIDVIIESNELGYFIDNLFEKQFDAWMAAWVVPIPTNLKISWYSDLEQTPLNFSSFQNKEIDELFNKLETVNEKEEAKIYKEIQYILYKNQPYSFLYWIDNIASYNNRITNISISPLGAIKNCWEWKLNNY